MLMGLKIIILNSLAAICGAAIQATITVSNSQIISSDYSALLHFTFRSTFYNSHSNCCSIPHHLYPAPNPQIFTGFQPNPKMVSDNVIRTAKSTIVLLCILDFIFLPWDSSTLGYIEKGNWKGIVLYLFMEQFLILATRKMDWFTIIFQTLSAVSVQTYLQLNSDSFVVKSRAGKLGVSTVLTAFVVLNATNTAGMVVLASNISRTIKSRRDLYLKVLGLGVIVAVKALPVFDSPGQTPLVATFTTMSKSNFTLLTGFLFTRLLISAFVQSMIIAITSQGDLRMIFQRIGIRRFDMDKLIPETKGDKVAKELEENQPKMTLNLTLVMFGLWMTVAIIRGCF
jgi:hypothetical protein